MSIKEISVWVGVLIRIQMLIAAVVTRINKDVFDFHKATSYARAVSELAKTKPVSTAVIRFCYVVCLIELVLLVFIKFSKKDLKVRLVIEMMLRTAMNIKVKSHFSSCLIVLVCSAELFNPTGTVPC